MKKHESGYRHCACRDCFEVVIGKFGALCDECGCHGCEANADKECCVPSAYGVGELDELDADTRETVRP